MTRQRRKADQVAWRKPLAYSKLALAEATFKVEEAESLRQPEERGIQRAEQASEGNAECGPGAGVCSSLGGREALCGGQCWHRQPLAIVVSLMISTKRRDRKSVV